jgi:hypothetical protein
VPDDSDPRDDLSFLGSFRVNVAPHSLLPDHLLCIEDLPNPVVWDLGDSAVPLHFDILGVKPCDLRTRNRGEIARCTPVNVQDLNLGEIALRIVLQAQEYGVARPHVLLLLPVRRAGVAGLTPDTGMLPVMPAGEDISRIVISSSRPNLLSHDR